jgi:hypothetical protein
VFTSNLIPIQSPRIELIRALIMFVKYINKKKYIFQRFLPLKMKSGDVLWRPGPNKKFEK